MANSVLHKRSSTPGAIPTTAALALGALALNTYDGRAFFKKNVSGAETIVELATTAAMAATYLPLAGGTLSGALTLPGLTSSGYTLFGRQANDVEGGEIHLQKPTTGSTLAGDLAIDLYGNSLRIFEDASPWRGVYVDIGTCASQSALLHSNNYSSYALPISGGTVSGAVSADYLVAWGSSSARGYAAMFAGDASHSGYVSFNAAGDAARGYIGHCDASQMTIATQYDADLAFVRNGVEKFRIGSGQSTIGALFLSGALTFCADAWNYSADGKNRLWFQTNGRSFYGSQDGHQFNTSSNALAGFLSDAGALMIAGNSMQISTSSTPVNGTTTGNAGEIRWDASYIYVCTSANTWKRAALSSF